MPVLSYTSCVKVWIRDSDYKGKVAVCQDKDHKGFAHLPYLNHKKGGVGWGGGNIAHRTLFDLITPLFGIGAGQFTVPISRFKYVL